MVGSHARTREQHNRPPSVVRIHERSGTTLSFSKKCMTRHAFRLSGKGLAATTTAAGGRVTAVRFSSAFPSWGQESATVIVFTSSLSRGFPSLVWALVATVAKGFGGGTRGGCCRALVAPQSPNHFLACDVVSPCAGLGLSRPLFCAIGVDLVFFGSRLVVTRGGGGVWSLFQSASKLQKKNDPVLRSFVALQACLAPGWNMSGFGHGLDESRQTYYCSTCYSSRSSP